MKYRHLLRGVLDAGAVLTAVVFIASYFPASVMLTPTTTNGGDMGTHYYPAWFLRHVLLPKGQVIGWCPGNYAGYPLFQFYFPLPFLLMAGLSTLVAFPVSFKLVSQLGTVLLPVCAYLSLRLGGIAFPGPALAALATLPFIFMEANSMWGGNIPSTLAGEFAFALGFALAILFVGVLRRTIETGRGKAWAGALVALIGLSHGYTLIWSGVTSLVELVSTRGWLRRLGTLIAIYGLGILLFGFFLLELVGYGPWTTAYNHSWPITGWRETMPPILWPSAIVSFVTTPLLLFLHFRGVTRFPRMLASLWGGIGFAFFFWLMGHSFHVVDIRFWPFIQLGLCLTAAAGLGHLVALLPTAEMWPVVGVAAILPFVQTHVTFIPSWIKWNYSGFEAKATWPTLRDVSAFVKGDFRAPRVVYEHSADNESLGTIRAFENLPLFSGRSTLEGLYMQSSPSSPFVFYIQSEISKDISCPFPDFGCARLNLDQGLRHLRMFNVSQFVLRSPLVKSAAAKHPGLIHEKTVGAYEIYRVRDNADRYAIPLELAPVLVVTDHWKDVAYRWFKRSGPEDPTPVFVPRADDEARREFGLVVDGLPDALPRQSLEAPPHLEEHLETDRITITGTKPGHPVLVRISYHPRWKSLTGERVWLAGPSFMLVIPRSDRIELVFDGGSWVALGHIFTAIGLLLFVVALIPPTRAAAERLAAWAGTLAPQPVHAFLRSAAAWDVRTRRLVLAAGVAAFVAVAGIAAAVGHVPNADGLYREGQALYNVGKLDESVPYFQRARATSPLSASAINASFFEGLVYFREEKWREGRDAFARIVHDFPEAANVPESLYHLGICLIRLGDVAGARQVWEDAHTRFADTQWGKYAGDRLAEVAAQGTGG